MTQMLLTIMSPIVQLSGSLLFHGEVCSGGGEAGKCEPLSPPSVRVPKSSVPVGPGPSPPSSLRLHLQAARPRPAGDRPQGGPEVPCRSEGLIYLCLDLAFCLTARSVIFQREGLAVGLVGIIWKRF